MQPQNNIPLHPLQYGVSVESSCHTSTSPTQYLETRFDVAHNRSPNTIDSVQSRRVSVRQADKGGFSFHHHHKRYLPSLRRRKRPRGSLNGTTTLNCTLNCGIPNTQRSHRYLIYLPITNLTRSFIVDQFRNRTSQPTNAPTLSSPLSFYPPSTTAVSVSYLSASYFDCPF